MTGILTVIHPKSRKNGTFSDLNSGWYRTDSRLKVVERLELTGHGPRKPWSASWGLFPGPRLPPLARILVRGERSRRGFPGCRGALARGAVRGCAGSADRVPGPAPAGCVVRADAQAHTGCQPFPGAAFLGASIEWRAHAGRAVPPRRSDPVRSRGRPTR